MAQNLELKAARQVAKAEMHKHDIELIREFVRNPVVEIIAGYVIIEALQKQGIVPSIAGTVAEGGILASVAYQQLAPIVPDLLKGGSEAVGQIFKALPALGALGV